MGDPLGLSIEEFSRQKNKPYITVQCDICEDDVIPVKYLFRTFEEMPDIEKMALQLVEGKILDIGAGAGCHALYLKDNGFDVTAIEKSLKASEYLHTKGVKTICTDIMSYSDEKFDTILLLMNGLGLAGSMDQLPHFLRHLKNLLKDGGKILCDSSDISYLFENEDGSIWIDLNSTYYGEVKYNMVYEGEESGWFDWLFIDQSKLIEIATDCGLKVDIILEGDNNHYLAEIKLK